MFEINNIEKQKIYDFFYQSSKQLENQINKMYKQSSGELRFFVIRITIKYLKQILKAWVKIKTNKNEIITKRKIVYLDKKLKYHYFNLLEILDRKKAEYPDIKYPKGMH